MRDKIKTIEELKEIIDDLRSQEKDIATTNGSFDLLHIGHIYMLESAKRLADILIVLLNSDSSVKSLKGSKRPVIPEKERAEILSSLECVDYVVIFSNEKPLNIIQELKPDLHIKGGEFDLEKIREEKELVESWDGRHLILPIIEGYSTTNIINRILKSNYQ